MAVVMAVLSHGNTEENSHLNNLEKSGIGVLF